MNKEKSVILEVKELVSKEVFEELKNNLHTYEEWEEVLNEIYIEIQNEEFLERIEEEFLKENPNEKTD